MSSPTVITPLSTADGCVVLDAKKDSCDLGIVVSDSAAALKFSVGITTPIVPLAAKAAISSSDIASR